MSLDERPLRPAGGSFASLQIWIYRSSRRCRREKTAPSRLLKSSPGTLSRARRRHASRVCSVWDFGYSRRCGEDPGAGRSSYGYPQFGRLVIVISPSINLHLANEHPFGSQLLLGTVRAGLFTSEGEARTVSLIPTHEPVNFDVLDDMLRAYDVGGGPASAVVYAIHFDVPGRTLHSADAGVGPLEPFGGHVVS